jgi:hypothetical protein
MKLERSKLDDDSTHVSDGDASLVERPVTELQKDPPALILVKKPPGGRQSAGHGSKLKRRKEEAILALLTPLDRGGGTRGPNRACHLGAMAEARRFQYRVQGSAARCIPAKHRTVAAGFKRCRLTDDEDAC